MSATSWVSTELVPGDCDPSDRLGAMDREEEAGPGRLLWTTADGMGIAILWTPRQFPSTRFRNICDRTEHFCAVMGSKADAGIIKSYLHQEPKPVSIFMDVYIPYESPSLKSNRQSTIINQSMHPYPRIGRPSGPVLAKADVKPGTETAASANHRNRVQLQLPTFLFSSRGKMEKREISSKLLVRSR